MSVDVRKEKHGPVALALASGQSITAVAAQAGISERTVRRQLARPAFRRLVGRLRQQLLDRACGRLAEHMTRAADALVELLPTADPPLRLRTARAILSLGLRLRDAVELADRLHTLERTLADRQGAVP